jgi:hypothetical protein
VSLRAANLPLKGRSIAMLPVGDDAAKAQGLFFDERKPREGMKDRRSGSLAAVATRSSGKDK